MFRVMFILMFFTSSLFISCAKNTKVNYLNETKEQRDQRMQWWRDARFGMFIHWGIYSVPAGEYNGQRDEGIGEWIRAHLNIPGDEYEKFAKDFNPVKFNAEEWVKLAKNAGMKYIVITSKHHDGFALWDSKVSDFDVVDSTPYGKDLLAPLSRECKKQGLKFCVYHSILDWHHPAQWVDPEEAHRPEGYGSNKMKEGKKQEYVTYLKAQLAELVTNYDPAVLWFDGEWVDWWTEEDGKDLYNYVRSLKPDIIINNRVGKGRDGMAGLSKSSEYAGDFGTPEQEIPDTGIPGMDWESCMTMNDTWGFKYFDENWKSTKTLLENLVDIASKGGNYLLNVGPTSEGLIPQASIERLQQIGEWMAVNGESVYATQASPFEKPEWGRYTKKGNKLYVHVFKSPKNNIITIPVSKNTITTAYSLENKDKMLTLNEKGDTVQINIKTNDLPATLVLELVE